MKQKCHLSLYCIIAACFLLCSGCTQKVEPVSQTEFYFDTVVTITLYETPELGTKRCKELLSSCFSMCEAYENMLSRTKAGSDIWQLNHAGGAAVTVHPETAGLLQKALDYCKQTDGLVDITIAPVADLWNFSSDHLLEIQSEDAVKNADAQNRDAAKPEQADTADANSLHNIPTETQLKPLLSHVDYRNVHIDGSTVTLSDPQAALDLGCIAKGYIADQLKAYLKQQGVSSALINLGGNLLTIGAKPDGSAFMLGIQRPFDQSGTPIAALPVTDASLVSSGIYERYFEADGTFYHHLLDPATGMPRSNDLLSVTILTDSSADADILSTAAFLMGLEDGMAYIEALPDVEAVFITKDYELHPSSALSELLQTQ